MVPEAIVVHFHGETLLPSRSAGTWHSVRRMRPWSECTLANFALLTLRLDCFESMQLCAVPESAEASSMVRTAPFLGLSAGPAQPDVRQERRLDPQVAAAFTQAVYETVVETKVTLPACIVLCMVPVNHRL